MLYRTILAFLLFFWAISAQAQEQYDTSKIAEIRIYFKASDWRALMGALRDSSEEARLVSDYVLVGGQKFPGAGIRFKGNSSFNNVQRSGQAKLPLNIKLNHTFPELALPSGHTTFKLANGFRDPSMVREVLAYEIVRRYMPAPRAAFAKVYINDAFHGLYTNVESIDQTFLRNRFGVTGGDLVKAAPEWRWKPPAGCPDKRLPTLNFLGTDTLCYSGIYEASGEGAWERLLSLAKRLENPSSDLSAAIDVDQALWMLALNNVMVNLDSYIGGFAQNYYIYFDTQGLAHPLIWDLNLSFGGFRLLTEQQTLDNNALQHLSLFAQHRERNSDRPLILRLLDDELQRKIYVAHCKTILEDYFFNGLYKERIRFFQQLIDPAVAQDKNFLYNIADFQRNAESSVEAHGDTIMGITELMEARIAYFKRHPLMNMAAPSIGAVTRGSESIQVKVGDAKRVWLFTKAPGQAHFSKSALKENEAGVWSSAALLLKGTQYYFVAENDGTASLLPRRAGVETFLAE